VKTKKQKKAARELLHAAHKVYHYRRDVTAKDRLIELDQRIAELEKHYRDPSVLPATLSASMDRVDALLRKIGGKMYPKTFWNDNIEVALVAAIVVIGIRTFFFQPFIIPTNSMYPTYSGMNSVIYENGKSPSAVHRAFRFLTLGARHKSLEARTSGRVQVPMILTANGPSMQVRKVKGKKFFIIPTVLAEYTLLVGGVPHTIKVPADFDMQSTILETYPNTKPVPINGGTAYVLDLDTQLKKGESILCFDITLGDALFVDRFSYHFKRPKAGDPFVFRTRNIPGIEGHPGDTVDKYYIKRIAGVGGESLEITEDGRLLANDEQRSEVSAFTRNAAKEGEYGGYEYPKSDPLKPPQLLTGVGVKNDIPMGNYVALGDNSANSLDSRYWGFVPEKSVIGKAIFIYYPFTKRWGFAE